MDMRFYPPPVQPPSATDPSCPDPSRRFDSLCCINKLDQECCMYMCTSELIQDFSPVSQVCPVSGVGDEDLGIPPIAPSTLPDSPYPPASDGGAYHTHLPPQAQSRHNGLNPFNSLTMDSPGLNISSTLSQNGDPAPSFLSAQMDDFRPSIQSVMVQQGQLTTINQSQLSPHLELSGHKVPHDSPSPPGSKRASLSPLSSIHEDESEEAPKGGGAEKRQAADTGKKPKAPKKKKKKDPNEPQKPVSAYALFFRDTQASIKGQKPGATFGEVSKIVASTWDSLGEEEKQLYKKKTELAKTEYLKQLAAYRASLVSQSRSPSSDVTAPESSNSPGPFPRSGQDCGVYPGLTHPQQAPAPLRLPGSKMESLMSFPRANMASQMSPHGANMVSPVPLHRADTGLQRCLPGANMAASMPPSGAPMAASSAPTQAMMQRCASLQHQQQFASHLSNQRPLSSHHQQLPLHLQSFASGFPPPAEFRGGMFNGFSAGGLALVPPMDYIQSGCRESSTEGVDWSTDYSSNGSLLG